MVDQDVLKVYPVMENPYKTYNGIEENYIGCRSPYFGLKII
jgi:hypothetical protein